LIDIRKIAVDFFQVVNSEEELFPGSLVTGVDELLQIIAPPVKVFLGVFSGAAIEDFLQDFQIVRNVEGVARILMAEEIVEIVKTRPGDGGKTQGTGFVSGKED
jgi:hypothetical protein